MNNQIKETIVCDSCGKNVPRTEIRYLRLKTCCSYRKVPVCTVCWEEMNKKA